MRRRLRFAPLGAALWGCWLGSCGGGPAPERVGRAAAAHPVPVLSARALRRDVPRLVDGLGVVAAYDTAVVHSRVDGELERVGFEEGQFVREGDFLAQLDPRPFRIALAQARASLAKDRATLRNGRLNWRRNRELLRRRLVSTQTVTDLRAQVDEFEAQIRVDEAAVASARLNLVYARISSPIDGVTGVRLIDPGNVVHASDPSGIVVVARVDPAAIYVSIPEDVLPEVVAQGARAPLRVLARSRDDRIDYGEGRVAVLDNQVNQATGTLRLKAIFPNPDRLLWPAQFVKVQVELGVLRGAVVVPSGALQRGPEGAFVYVVRQDQTVEMRRVEPGPAVGGSTVIGRGLAPGEEVVTEGQLRLKPGSRVTVQASGPYPVEAAGGLMDP